MTTTPVPPPDGRTRYANGERRRAEIVEAASTVFAEQGFQNLSLRQIADAIGVSHTLLRHHFGRKEAILEAVLARREERDKGWRTALFEEHGVLDAIPLTMARNATTPGLIQLDTLMHAEAVNPEHPAHEYVVGLAHRFRAQLTADLRAEQEAGRVRADVNIEMAALCLASLIEGVQVEWLLDRSVDMAAVVGSFVEQLRA
ncbi:MULTISPECIES: TetR/AcrR family transcriptional regulator [unclassified Actinomyces]|uniref:TetR/AcrR family transcriptional regulator n=1 Tax=unclassified Actinomyces TaxID=2609248 RepID=UPI0020176FC3|nr:MULTISPECIES: TetR/AcrR family transcriptional regulator [unclassified Actinomyces]MCL3777412.1 TetR/AcrR family transcriptional regulator [Actinomyces sp. AC-20-1]MCL3790770.1 TetR/AcrR family transcriptional regulator [Actinomyces sp. 187325]MCL3792106.1 TetR/AcrR family transcriptional regulator [Actinomyces sp. 186855]MCL3793867.1 TetR/AcrR family transcriptional regulator [Actinomyces sp. 217892]